MTYEHYKAKLRWREGRDGESFQLFTWYACVLSYFSHVQLLPTPQTTVHQAALAMGFPRQEQWSELFDIQEILLTQRSKLGLLHWQVGSLALGPPGKPHSWYPSMLLP